MSYLSLYGFRVILLSLVPVFLFVVLKKQKKIRIEIEYLFFVIIFFMVLLFSAHSRSSVSAGMLVFSVFYMWPSFQLRGQRNEKIFRGVLSVYLAGVIFCAAGVVAQRLIFEYFSIEVGKIDYYGGSRIGFGFIWLDYSFLSLYIASAIPLLFLTNISYKLKMFFMCFLIVASLTTTARAGLFALFLSVILYFAAVFFKSLILFHLKKVHLKFVFIGGGLFLFAAFYLAGYSTREFSFSGSGRLEGYLAAIGYLTENFSYGALFSTEAYKNYFPVIPHNVFLYSAVMGGVFFLVLILIWMVSIAFSARRNSEAVQLSLLTTFFGLQFIPSVFSGYFIAALLGLASIERLCFKSISHEEA